MSQRLRRGSTARAPSSAARSAAASRSSSRRRGRSSSSALALVGSGLGSWEWSAETRAGLEVEEAALERGDLGGAAEQQARMWLAPDVSPDVHELTVAMTLRSYEQQLPLEDQVRAVWPEPPAEQRLAEIRVPTLVVVGSEDVDDIKAIAGHLAAAIPGARLVTVEGAGHLPSLERPDELNALLLDFL